MDTDNDGILDIVSSSYYNGGFLFKGLGNGQYKKGENIVFADGSKMGSKDTKGGFTGCSINYTDWDHDGDNDLLVSDLFNQGTNVFINEGSDKNPKYSNKKIPVKTVSNNPIRSFSLLYYDWDKDGKNDFIGGGLGLAVVFYKNIGTKNEPKFADFEYLIGNKDSYSKKMKYWASMRGKVNEKPSESEWPEDKWHISIADYNADGKDDILIGDNYRQITENKDLTEEGKKKAIQLKQKMDELNRISNSLRSEIRAITSKARKEGTDPSKVKIPEDMINKLNDITKQKNQLYPELRKYSLTNSEAFGRVWVFLRK